MRTPLQNHGTEDIQQADKSSHSHYSVSLREAPSASKQEGWPHRHSKWNGQSHTWGAHRVADTIAREQTGFGNAVTGTIALIDNVHCAGGTHGTENQDLVTTALLTVSGLTEQIMEPRNTLWTDHI